MIASALQREQLRSEPDREECTACGGSGKQSRPAHGTDGTCCLCKGQGSIVYPEKEISHSSKSNEHYTPANIVEAARKVLGGIDLDPASCELANEVVQAEVWYGPGSEFGEDGLAEPGAGRVFLNPPGGRVPDQYKGLGTLSSAALWWAVWSSMWQEGEIDSMIFIGFNIEILRSAQALDVPQPIDFPFCVPKNRIAFDTPLHTDQGEPFKRVPSNSPTHANVIVYLPPKSKLMGVYEAHADRFSEVFTPIGKCRL